MALPPGVPPGARKLVITSLHSPACFWGHEEFSNCKSRDIEKLDLLEKEISRVYRNSKVGDDEHYVPTINELVAVLDPIKKTWVRGRVTTWNDRSGRGEILLVDYGSHLSDVKLVRPLPSHAHEIKCQAVQMFLYGVLPLLGQYDYALSKFSQTSNWGWMPAALRKVQDLLSESVSFHFTCSRCWGEALLGDLYIHREGESRASSLTKILIDENMAVYDYVKFNEEIDTRVGNMMLVSSRGEELRPVCLGAGVSFATLAQQHGDLAPPLKELGELSVNKNNNFDSEYLPAGMTSTTQQPPARHAPAVTSEPRGAQGQYRTSPRRNEQQDPPRGNRFTNDQRTQGPPIDRKMQSPPRGNVSLKDRQMQVSPRGERQVQGPSRNENAYSKQAGVSRDSTFPEASESNFKGRVRQSNEYGELKCPHANNFQNSDRSDLSGRKYYQENDGPRGPPMNRAGRFEERDNLKSHRSGFGEQDSRRGPPMGRAKRFEDRVGYEQDGGRGPPMGRAKRFEDRDRPGAHGDSYCEQKLPLSGGNHYEEKRRAGPLQDNYPSEDEEVRRLTMGRDSQRNDLKRSPRREGQFNIDAGPSGPRSAKGQHPSNQQGPYGDANARKGPRDPWPSPQEPYESRPQEEDVSGISKLPGEQCTSSMLTQLTGHTSQDAETVYKKPQPRVQGPAQKFHAAPTQPNIPAMAHSGPGAGQSSAINIEHDATKPVPPAPVNKYAGRGPGGKKLGSHSNASSSSSKDEGQWFPPLLNTSQPQLPVLVQGCDLSKPLDSLGKAYLQSDIHRTLEQMRIKGLTIQQKHMLPAMFRGQNIVSVGPAESGKTLGFIIPLASSMLDPSKYIELKDVFGPLVLILCANAERATSIDKWFRHLTHCDLKDYVYSYNKGYKDTQPRVKVLLTYGGGAENEKLMELFNGCHVLISTPPCLLRMLSFWEEVLTNFNRLCHLVFDDADILFEKFNLQVGQILKLAQKGLGSEERKNRNLQTIVTAKQWTEALEQFASRVLTNPTIIINTGLEVMAYSKVVPSLHIIEILDSRSDVLLEIVKSQEHPFKMVVACTFQYEALDLHRKLQSHVQKENSTLLLVAHEGINQLGLISLKEKWEANNNILLVVSDTVLSEMDIFDASVLVHFSMTDQRPYFNTRMSTIIKKCPDRFSSIKEQRETAKPQVHMLIVEQDTVQIPLLMELMRRLKAPIPPVLLEREKQENLKKEERKKELPLCDQLCCFGTCTSPFSCSYRHGLISEMDTSPQYIPESGEVKLKPMTVHNATHISARIEEHRSLDGKLTPVLSKEHVYLPIEISEHFSIHANSAGEHEEMEYDEPHKSSNADENWSEKEHQREEIELQDEHMDQALDQGEVEPRDESGNQELDQKEESELEDESDINNATFRDPRSPLLMVVNKKPKLEGEAGIFHVRRDLFDAPVDFSLAHCVAEDLVMKRGVAKGFYDRFGQQAVLRAQRKRCGQVAYIQAGGRYVFYLITKQRTNSSPISLEVLQTCLVELRRLCGELNVKNLAMPQLGRGLNHMNWEDVRACLEDIFSQSGIAIGVYHILILEMEGDIMTAPSAFSLAHCVAQDLIMSRGVAKQFKSKFNGQVELMKQDKKVGEVAYLKVGRRFIFYLITKRFSTPDCKPTLDTLRSSLLNLKEKCLEFKVSNLAMPKIGTGIDQLSWCDVRTCLEEVFLDTDIEIRVYNLPDGDTEPPQFPDWNKSKPHQGSDRQARFENHSNRGNPRPQDLLRSPSNHEHQWQLSSRQVFRNPDQQPPFLQDSPMHQSSSHIGRQSPSINTCHSPRQQFSFEGRHSPYSSGVQNRSLLPSTHGSPHQQGLSDPEKLHFRASPRQEHVTFRDNEGPLQRQQNFSEIRYKGVGRGWSSLSEGNSCTKNVGSPGFYKERDY